MSIEVELTYQDQVARIRIRREKSLNALNLGVLNGILSACEEIKAECSGRTAFERCRSVLIQGEGERAFVAGADIKHMAEATSSERHTFAELGQSVMRAIEALPLPVIAQVQGYALGGGLELALACDLIFASTSAVFGQPEVNLGLIPGFGGTQRLALRCGLGPARRLILSGENMSAEEAYRIGLVDYLSSPEDLEADISALCSTLHKRGPLALASAKRAIEALHGESLAHGLDNEVAEFMNLFEHDDTKEGLTAFLEKRSPQFKGK